jgi:hypothetical protein
MMWKVEFNIAKDGVHYLGGSLRWDTSTPEKAEEFRRILERSYRADDGFSVSVSLRPAGKSYGVQYTEKIGEAIDRLEGTP